MNAVVNAANKELLGGAGVCGAIFKAAGWDKLQAACDQYPAQNDVRCPIGSARITSSFDLKSRGIDYIIHAVGPDCRIITDESQQNSLLSSTYKNSLMLAEQHSLQSLAFPFISSGIYGFPKQRAAHIALKSIVDYINNNPSKINSIYLVLFSQDEFDLFVAVAKKIISP